MSRIARKPLQIPAGVQLSERNNMVSIKGPKGEFKHLLHKSVEIQFDGKLIHVRLKDKQEQHKAMLGTTYVLLKNYMHGVHIGFEKKLFLHGIGYRAKIKDKNLELNLGYSHPVLYQIPKNINIEIQNNIEISVRGASKEQVGQVSAEIRVKQPPEPYKGKGVRYADEFISLKETKKK